jgi:RimJ/RimL family protein N-acetyltransferase
MYGAFKNGDLKGYVLTYTALEFPSIILECEIDVAEKLIGYVSEDRFIMHAPPYLLTIVKRKYPNLKYYVEDWMLVKKGEASFFKSALVRRLHSEEDASKLALLLSNREERPTGTVERYLQLISKTPTYGVFIKDKLMAYAGSFIQLPQIWMIGGVYTHLDHRNKGYSTMATSAVTEEALRNAEAAALFVRSDNYPAIRVYQKIGYAKIGKKLWVDVGTGLKP